jgi:hypothetical protein
MQGRLTSILHFYIWLINRIKSIFAQRHSHPCPGNNAAIGWFVARPSGNEALFKLYGKSFISQAHLHTLLQDAKAMVDRGLKG